MLIEFTVGNYRSIKDPVILSMVAANLLSKNKELDEENVIRVENNLNLLTSAAIYGANASGKSNIASSIRFMRTFVLESSKDTQSEEDIQVDRFRLSTATEKTPSFFQMVFLMEGKKYRYGFEITTERVVSEWLYYVPRSREARLFERSIEGITVSDNFKEGRGIPERTRENALFLSVVAQFNGNTSRKILNWFRRMSINLGINDTVEHARAVTRFDDSKDKDAVLQFIKYLDLGIDSIHMEREPIKVGSSLSNMPEELSKFFQSIEGMEMPSIKTVHRKYNSDGKVVGQEIFNMDDQESEGTKRLFTLAAPVTDALHRGRVLIIDEIDARIHPLITCSIIGLFNNKKTNPRNAQLIFTTHDTNLLSNKIFRRDQIWFVEKDKFGITHLYSLAEFKVRNDSSFERDYVRGKFGAIPFIGDLQFVFGGEDGEE